MPTCLDAQPLASSILKILGIPKCFSQQRSKPLVNSSTFLLLRILIAQYRVA